MKEAGILFMKTKSLAIIFSLFLLITLASASIVFLTKEKNQAANQEQLVKAEKQTELSVGEPVKPKPQSSPKKIAAPEPEKVEIPQKINQPPEEKNSIVMIIDSARFQTTIKPGSSVYDLMNLLKTENKINFSGKNYAELGFFVEEINGIKNNPAGKNWIYYINGRPAQVGVSNYLIKNNDLIEWKYEEKNF